MKSESNGLQTALLRNPPPHAPSSRGRFGSADGPLQERLFRLDKHVSVEVLRSRAPRLERAIANAMFYEKARRFRNFDEDTGLPNAAYLAQRIREEIARAGARDDAFAVAVVRIANFAELDAAGDPVKTRRALHIVVDALRRNAREFDVLTRCENAEFALLIPEPGHDPAQRVLDLARAVSEDVTRDERVNTPHRIALAFGYAIHGKDGPDARSLLARAREPRIHMV